MSVPAGLLLAALALGPSTPASPAPTPAPDPAPTYQVKQLADNIFELWADGGGYPVKVVASVGPDGLLLVDTGEPDAAASLLATLEARGWGKPKVVINTHSHIEHLGGNAALGNVPAVIGHARLRERWTRGLYAFRDRPMEGLPNVTFEDTLSLHWNGEEVRLVALGGAHDDSDTAVLFTGSKVAVVGALCMGTHFPSIDGERGDIRRYPEVAARLLELLPEDAKVVPAHADDCGKAECRGFQKMLAETGEAVRRGLGEGKDAAALKKQDLLAPWTSYESAYVKKGDWIAVWARGLAADTPDLVRRPRPIPVLHDAYVAGGVDGMLARWRELKATAADRYTLDGNVLLWVGRRLTNNDRPADGKKLLELVVAESAGTEAASIAHATLGTVAYKAGDRPAALAHYREYLRRFPEDEAVGKRVAELEKDTRP